MTGTLKPSLVLFIGFGILIVSRWFLDLSAQSWDWDINHMMYFGHRLLAGDFHWLAEFDDKLPVLQMIFALPAAFDSITVWVCMSLTCVLGGAAGAYTITFHILGSVPGGREQRMASLLAALGTAYLVTFTFGGIHHVNPMATSFGIMGIAMVLATRKPSRSKTVKTVLFTASAAFASVAIGIRPYFLLPLIVACLWVFARPQDTQRTNWRHAGVATGGWVVCVGAFGVLVNVIPFFVLGHSEALFAGLGLLAQELNPQGLKRLVTLALTSLNALDFPSLVIFLLAMSAACFSGIEISKQQTRQVSIDTLILVLCLPGLLAFMILNKHFWPHYLQLFAPFWGIGLGLFYAQLLRHFGGNGSNTQARIFPRVLALTAVVVFALPQAAINIRDIVSAPNMNPRDQQVAQVASFLQTRPVDKRDFIALNDMYLHWHLQETRHGFPHAANTQHIIQNGWWNKVDMPSWFDHPTTAKAYCDALEKTGPSLVMLRGKLTAFGQTCLQNSGSYKQISQPQIEAMAIFTRL